jgi:hypothetical protein
MKARNRKGRRRKSESRKQKAESGRPRPPTLEAFMSALGKTKARLLIALESPLQIE